MPQNPLGAYVAVGPTGKLVPLKVDANGALIVGTTGTESTPVSNSSGNLAATAGAATLPAAAGKTTYITGFTVTGAGATAASIIEVTVTGVTGGTMTYALTIPAGVTTAVQPLSVNYNPPIPATAANTTIAVNIPSFGAGNTNASVVATGYQV